MIRKLGQGTIERDARRLRPLISGAAIPVAAIQHNFLSPTHTDTVAAFPVRGDLVVANATPEWERLAIGAANFILRSDGTDPAWADPTLWLPLAPTAQNEMIIANAVPAWSLLAAPTAQHQRLSTGAAPFTPTWINNLPVIDDAFVGITAGGRFVFDSTPIPDEIRVVSANLDLNGYDFILDADGDTYLHTTADDIAEFVLATASGQLTIEINTWNDFTFTANALNVLPGSAIVMGDGTTIGQAAGPLITFDDTNNYLEVMGADVGVGTATPGYKLHIYVDSNAEMSSCMENANAGAAASVAFIAVADGGQASLGMCSTGWAAHRADRAFVTGEDDTAGLDLIASAATGTIKCYTGGSAVANLAATIATDGDIGIGAAPLAKLHIRNPAAQAQAVLRLGQSDVDQPFIYFKGEAAAGVLSRSIVDAGDEGSSTHLGWLQVYVEDVGNQIADASYVLAIYGLSA